MRAVWTWLGWWIALYVLWLAYVGTVDLTEQAAGAVAAAIGATAAAVVAAQGLLRYSLEGRWFAKAWKIVWQTPYEFWILTLALVRHTVLRRDVRGRWRTEPFPATGAPAASAGRRAWVSAMGTVTPNTIVVDIDPETGLALLHDLDAARAFREPL